MKLNDLLAMVGRHSSSHASLDHQVSLAQLLRLDLETVRPPIASASNEVPSGSGADEASETMVYVAVPLSMLTSAAISSVGKSRRTHVHRWRYDFAGWSLAVDEQSLVAPGGGVLQLRKAECALLLAFLEQPRQVLTRRRLAALVRRPNRPMLSDRGIDTYVCRLRAYFRETGGPGLIACVHSVGYRFDSDVSRT